MSKRNIALDGAPKATRAVPVHGGMNFRTRDGQHITGLSHQAIVNAPDASGKRPLDPTMPGKTHVQPASVIGQRSRGSDPLHGGAPGEAIARSLQPHVPPPPAFKGLGTPEAGGTPKSAIDHALGTKILDEAFQRADHDTRNTRRVFVPARGKC